MNKSRYESRAKAIHGERKHEVPTDISQSEYWRTRVKSPDDVVAYYTTYYPHFTRELVLSIADYYRKIVSGDAPLPEHLSAKKSDDTKWDFKKEIEEEKLDAEIKKTTKRLEELMDEEDQQNYKGKKRS